MRKLANIHWDLGGLILHNSTLVLSLLLMKLFYFLIFCFAFASHLLIFQCTFEFLYHIYRRLFPVPRKLNFSICIVILTSAILSSHLGLIRLLTTIYFVLLFVVNIVPLLLVYGFLQFSFCAWHQRWVICESCVKIEFTNNKSCGDF